MTLSLSANAPTAALTQMNERSNFGSSVPFRLGLFENKENKAHCVLIYWASAHQSKLFTEVSEHLDKSTGASQILCHAEFLHEYFSSCEETADGKR